MRQAGMQQKQDQKQRGGTMLVQGVQLLPGGRMGWCERGWIG